MQHLPCLTLRIHSPTTAGLVLASSLSLPFQAALAKKHGTLHSTYRCLFFFSLLPRQVHDLKHWNNTCWQKLSNWSWQRGTERARDKWQGPGADKNKTIVSCFISSLGLMKPYLYSSRVLVYNTHKADLILTLASEMLLRRRL